MRPLCRAVPTLRPPFPLIALAMSSTLSLPAAVPSARLLRLPSFVGLLTHRAVYHSAFWTLIYLFNTIYVGYLIKDYTYSFYDFSVKLPFLLAVSYANSYYLLPRLLWQRRYGAYALAMLGLLLSLTVLMQILLNRLVYADLCPRQYVADAAFSPRTTLEKAFFVLTLVGLTTAFKLAKDWLNQQQYIREVEQQKLRNELAVLKSQIQPHFFFNTLNTLYSLTLKKSDQAPEIVLKLADLMSYMLYEAEAPCLALAKELASLENYLDLERLRFGPSLALAFRVTGLAAKRQIAPLLLLPFIENSFKHSAALPGEPLVITIEIEIADAALTLVVDNPKGPPRAFRRPHGLGLPNVRRRLALIYPNTHTLHITETATRYRVELTLPL